MEITHNLFFLKLLLLKRGGQVIYAGDLGRQSHKLVAYFEVSYFGICFGVGIANISLNLR